MANDRNAGRKRKNTKPMQVRLPPDLIEWAKNQPGGQSVIVERVLMEEKNRQELVEDFHRMV